MQHDYDIILIGAGLVGTSLVTALQGQGLKIAVLEKNLPSSMTSITLDNRPISLAYASYLVLKTMNVWSDLEGDATPINNVHISEQGRLGTMKFKAHDLQLPALGYVVPYSKLIEVLYQHAAKTNVTFISSQEINTIEAHADGMTVEFTTVEGSKKLHCQLLIAADGTRSRARALLNIATTEEDSHEVAATTLLKRETAHDHIAYERFTRDGTLAILPLSNKHECRLVWTMTRAMQATVNAWDDAYYAEYVQAAFSGRLGQLQVIERGEQFPLVTVIAKEQVRPGFVLVGNAAHTLYPIAAQGFNLGLRDVAALAEVLIDAHRHSQALGDAHVLRDYEQWRTRDQQRTIGLTRGISNIFGLQLPMLGFFRSVSMLTADLLPPIKSDLAKQALGLYGRLPKLMRGLPL